MQSEDISRCFRILDPCNRKFVNSDEASCMLRAVTGIADMTQEEVHATVKAMDVECNGVIVQSEFERLVSRKISERSLPEDAWRSFVFLSEGRGKIVASDLDRFYENEQSLSRAEWRSINRLLRVNERPVMYEAWKRVVVTLKE